MNTKKSLFFLSILTLVICIFNPVSYAAKSFNDKEVRIGTWGPLTGIHAAYGAATRISQTVWDLVNEEGGIHGRKFRLYTRDNQNDPTQTKVVVKELVERKGLFCAVSGISSICSMAVKDYLTENKVPFVPLASSEQLTSTFSPYMYSVFMSNVDQFSILMKYTVENLGYRKIGYFYGNDSYGRNGMKGCKQRLDHYGMKLVEAIPVEHDDKDLSSQMLRFKNAGAEAILAMLPPVLQAIAIKTCAKINYKPQWVVTAGACDYDMMCKLTGGLFEGVITGSFCEPPNSNHPLMVKYRDGLKRLAPKEKWTGYSPMAILYWEPLVEAFRRVGRNLSTEAFVKALDTMKDFQGIGPKITFTLKNHQGSDTIMIKKCGPNASYILLQDYTSNDL